MTDYYKFFDLKGALEAHEAKQAIAKKEELAALAEQQLEDAIEGLPDVRFRRSLISLIRIMQGSGFGTEEAERVNKQIEAVRARILNKRELDLAEIRQIFLEGN